ncbi:MAG: CYTH domain-containing protein [Bacteroidales bacterium]
MAYEIEHKYLVKDNSYLELAHKSTKIVQGYISRNKNATVRVRITDSEAYLTIKGISINNSRPEYEYPIPVADAHEMVAKLCNNIVIDKTRHYVTYDNHLWEIDTFHGKLEGLIVAEIELTTNDQPYTLPPFIGENVTTNPLYYNSNLINLVKKK